jgi:dihydrofolate synthase/folylpolyglutamate synthase
VTLIVGMFGRKDAPNFFPHFTTLGPRVFTTLFQSPSAAPADLLAEAAGAAGLRATPAEGVEDALDLALAEPGLAPHVIVCGGLHFVGDVLAMTPETWPT